MKKLFHHKRLPLIGTAFIAFISLGLNAQNNVGIGTTSPNTSAMLDVTSTSKGMLVPRLTTAQRTAITTPANGLIVYDTNLDCFFYYIQATTTWQSTCPGTGPSGTSSLIATSVVAAGVNCPNGGVQVQIGTDTNNNGVLDPSEVVSTQYVCNGSNGTIGSNGTTGLVKSTTEPAGANCANGGIKVETGTDTNNNGVLDPSEITATNYICNGATGATGPNWTITSDNFNTAGNLVIVTTAPQTVTSTNAAWLVGGNNNAALGSMGATSNQSVNFITNNVERFRMINTGGLSVNHTVGNGDMLSVFANNTTNGTTGSITNTISDYAIGGYSAASGGAGLYGENTAANGAGTNAPGILGVNTSTTSGYGIFGTSAGATGLGILGTNTSTGTAIFGFSNTGADGVVGSVTGLNSFGVWGMNATNTSGTSGGTGVAGSGNGGTTYYLFGGSGGAFTGRRIGVFGRVSQDSTTAGILKAGGYFESNMNAYAYVGAVTTANTIRKIEGTGTLNTVVKNMNNRDVVLSAPEAPENLFEDYGSGSLVNGAAYITIDPVFAKNIVVNDQHPLRVFIQLEGDCKGVYVSNKTNSSFEVKELNGGNSNVKFMWHIVANRADEVLNDGSVSKYSDERFAPAIGRQAQEYKKAPEAPNTVVPKRK